MFKQKNFVFNQNILSEVIQLEQETVMGMESLILLCSQDDSKTAQATLKVSVSQRFTELRICDLSQITFSSCVGSTFQ